MGLPRKPFYIGRPEESAAGVAVHVHRRGKRFVDNVPASEDTLAAEVKVNTYRQTALLNKPQNAVVGAPGVEQIVLRHIVKQTCPEVIAGRVKWEGEKVVSRPFP